MANILDQMRLWTEQMIINLGYLGIALLMFLENVFPPIPSEIIMPFAGSLAAQGEMNFMAVLVSGTAGSVAGVTLIYYIGIWIKEERVRNWLKQYGHLLLMSEEDYDKADSAFDRHGEKMVFLGRLFPTIRSLISLPAGLNRMNLSSFLFFTVLGTALWNVILLAAGMLLGENWQRVIDFVNSYEMVFWIIFAIGVAYYVYNRVSASDEEQQSSER